LIYDAIIVGLGPGGSVAARTLARHGMRVLAFEKMQMPRYKPCGGALSTRVHRVLDDDLCDVIETNVYGSAFTFCGAERFSARFHKPVVHMVMRPQFDHMLSQSARDAGAEIRQKERVRSIQPGDAEVEVSTSRGVYRAAWLIGADGASSLVRRYVTQQRHADPIAGLEAEITPEHQIVQQYTEEVTLDFGAMPHGYSWIFPKREHLSVGTAGAFRQVPHPRHFYGQFLDHEGLGRWTDEKVHGHIIPIHLGGSIDVQRGRVILVGDAARLVDPFLGEGIYYAIKSAHIASQALLDAGSQALTAGMVYEERLRTQVVTELHTALKVARLLYCFPHYGYYLFKTHPVLIDRYFQVLCGDMNLDVFYRALRRTALGNLLRSTRWWRDVQIRVPRLAGHKMSVSDS
jgi:geranylgeranyl reductase family protein